MQANAGVTPSESPEKFASELKTEKAHWEKAIAQAGLVIE